MELMPAPLLNGTSSPFQRKDVREWHCVNPLTGGLLQGRQEADRWISGPNNRYGKVTDSRNLSNPDGSHHSQHKQLEIHQTRTPGRSIQTVRTVSSTKWTSGTILTSPKSKIKNSVDNFDGLDMVLHSLDLTPQKSKANICRSGTMASRRRPTRTKSFQIFTNNEGTTNSEQNIEKSNSTENLSSLENFEESEKLQEWRRESKLRRSLQFPKTIQQIPNRPADLPDNIGIVSKIRHEIETKRRLKKAISGTSVDFEAINRILNGNVNSSRKEHIIDIQNEADFVQNTKPTSITTEAIQEVRDRLRPPDTISRTSSLSDDGFNEETVKIEEIEEDAPNNDVSSYIYGMKSNTGSLETRKVRESESWLDRRQSYGFEPVPTVECKISREESSDSGICHSTENGETWMENVKTLAKKFEDTSMKSTAQNEEMVVTNDSSNNKKIKKVEFCKTEVHFAAESGRINIIETDCKPPPSNNFRRRRKITPMSKMEIDISLPVTHFGDIEQKLHDQFKIEEISETNASIRGILKNKLPKPIPYFLGDNVKPIIEETSWQTSPIYSSAVKDEFPISKILNKVVEDKKNGGFLTKVNFGSEQTIIETHSPNWSPVTSEGENNDITTTKITIDICPNDNHGHKIHKVPDSEELKSTSLIMKTIQIDPTPRLNNLELEQKLIQLRELYENNSENSDEDEEIKRYLGNVESNKFEEEIEEFDTELSGSWSRVRASKNMDKYSNRADVNSFQVLDEFEDDFNHIYEEIEDVKKLITININNNEIQPRKLVLEDKFAGDKNKEQAFTSNFRQEDIISSNLRNLRDNELNYFGIKKDSNKVISNESHNHKIKLRKHRRVEKKDDVSSEDESRGNSDVIRRPRRMKSKDRNNVNKKQERTPWR